MTLADRINRDPIAYQRYKQRIESADHWTLATTSTYRALLRAAARDGCIVEAAGYLGVLRGRGADVSEELLVETS